MKYPLIQKVMLNRNSVQKETQPMADRESLKNRVAPLEIYKVTPRTNCGECGQNTCLAFATLATAGQQTLTRVPTWIDGRSKPCGTG